MYKVASLFVVAIFVIDGTAGEPCPNVGDLTCTWSQPVEESCRVETTITLTDGTQCLGCQTCVRPGDSGRPGFCPFLACPMWQRQEDCTATFFIQRFTLENGRQCRACDSFLCVQEEE